MHAVTFLAISSHRRPANVVHAHVFLASLAAHQRRQPPTITVADTLTLVVAYLLPKEEIVSSE